MIAMSCLNGLAISYAGLRVQQLVTATSFMVLTNVNKVHCEGAVRVRVSSGTRTLTLTIALLTIYSPGAGRHLRGRRPRRSDLGDLGFRRKPHRARTPG